MILHPVQYPFLHRSRCNCTIGERKAKTKEQCRTLQSSAFRSGAAGEESKMAHIITDAEAQTLTRIAKSLIGPIVSQGLIQKRDMDDAVQELLLEAVRLSDQYDDSSAAEFITYAHGVMKIQVLRVIRKFRSATSRILTDAISIDAVCDAEDTDDAPDYSKIGMLQMQNETASQEHRRQEQILRVRSVINCLPSDSQVICRLLIADCSVAEISRRTALSRKTLRRKIEFIKSALLEAGVIIRGKNN